MDILKYSALNAINKTCALINGGANTAANTSGLTEGNAAAANLGPSDAANWQANGATYVAAQTLLGAGWCNSVDNMPWCYSSWAGAIPRMPGSTSTSDAGLNPVTGSQYCGFKVCATNFYGAASNTWTVPANTQYARFQIWGAGGNGGSGCCCGGSTWGVQGAYASVIIPVVPGCQYTLCAGCARPTTTIWSSWSGRGCQSYVTGYGLSNFCAEAGECLGHYILQYQDWQAYSRTGCCRWSSADCFAGGGCICNSQLDWCFSNSCASCGHLPHARAAGTNYYGCYNGPVTPYSSVLNVNFLDGMQVTGIPGLHGRMCFDTNYYGISWPTAVYGYESVTADMGGFCFAGSTTGGICCNHVGYNYRRAPGAGATSTHLFGGCTAMCDPSGNLSCGGDIGRSGMVCVTWF